MSKGKTGPWLGRVWAAVLAPGTSMLFWTAIMALAACVGIIVSLYSFKAAQDEQKIFEWQRTIIYQIIDEATRDSADSIGLSAIENTYSTEVLRVEGITINRAKLQRFELQRILMTLAKDKLVGHTSSNQYYIYRQNDCGGDQSPAARKAELSIFRLLKARPGQYKVDQLRAEIRKEVPQLNEEEYVVIINCLLSRNVIILDDYLHLFSQSDPPSRIPLPPMKLPGPFPASPPAKN